MEPILRAALVGYGLAGKVFHTPLIDATSGLSLAMIVSSDAEKVHADWPAVTVVSDYATALQDPSIDMIIIATPDHLHEEQALAALDAGKHVIIDKPVAPSLCAAQNIANHAKAKGRIASAFHNRRWDADFLTLKRLIDQDRLGDIVSFESHFDRYRPATSDSWKANRAAGVWQDLGPHLVDQAVQLFGLPEGVYADLAIQKQDGLAPDYAHVLLRYGKRRVILNMAQLTMASGLRYAIHGTKGSYIKHGIDSQEDQSKAGMKPSHPDWGVDPQPGILTSIDPSGAASEVPLPNLTGNYLAFYEGVSDAMLGRAANPVPIEQAVDVMRIIEAGRTSAKDGREIRL